MMLQKVIKSLPLLVLNICIINLSSSLNLESAFIQGQYGTSLLGSVKGGTKIIIKGSGFPNDFTTIKIMIGSYPCILQDGIPPTLTSISCLTSNSGSLSSKFNLEIKVVCNGQPFILNNYKFTYKGNQSPYLQQIIPSSSFPTDYLNFYGYHNINHTSIDSRDTQDITGLYIGKSLCNIIDISQQIQLHEITSIRCASAGDQQAGKYTVLEHVNPGYAINLESMRKTSFIQGQYYEHTVVPVIQNVSPKSGFTGGQNIIIEGKGFSQDESKVQVTINGVNCQINSATIHQISCRLAQRDSQAIPIQTNSLNQQNGFIGGAGFKYQKYQISDLSDKTYSGLKESLDNGVILSKIQQRVVAQLEAFSETGQYGKVFRGYFYAPFTGNYTFRGAGNDNFGLYLSQFYGSSQVGNIPHLDQNIPTNEKDNYYITNFTSALGGQVYFEADHYYYMELYMVNVDAQGFVKISVQVPNNNSQLFWQTYQVNKYQIDFTNEPQIRTFNLTFDSTADGSFKLFMYQKQAILSLESKLVEVDIPYNATEIQFQSALKNFKIYNYQFSVGLNIYDEFGNQVSSSMGCTFVWTIKIWQKRPEDQILTIMNYDLSGISSNSKKLSQVIEQTHGNLISGTYSIFIGNQALQIYDTQINDYTIDIPYDVDKKILQSAFRRIAGFQNTEVNILKADCQYGCTYLITYPGYNNDVPDLSFSIGMLSGGKIGTSPFINFYQVRKHSHDLIINPIDERMMFMTASNPHVKVSVNNVFGSCFGHCQYIFLQNSPIIQSQILSANQLAISINNSGNFIYSLSQVKVFVRNHQCNNLKGNITDFTCQLPLNSDGSIGIQAGNYDSEIWVSQKGKILKNSTLSPLSFPLIINNISPVNGQSNGGYNITVEGNGFPLQKQDVQIHMCGNIITPHTISSTQTIFTAPQCSDGLEIIQYIFNGISVVQNFQYINTTVSVTITAISPNSSSPVLKKTIQIQGVDFPSDSSNYKVYLKNNDKTQYQLKVLQNNQTSIICGLPGGLPGQYQLFLEINNQGNALAIPQSANDFIYQLVITGISPIVSNYYGGTLITINGRNFSPILNQNIITVGSQINWLCRIQSVSQTKILCRTPPYHPDWSSNVQQIILTNKLISKNTCQGVCNLTYSDKADSITLNSISASAVYSQKGVLKLIGMNFDQGNLDDLKVIFMNKLTNKNYIYSPHNKTDTEIQINVPLIQGGFYDIKIRLDPYGETNSLPLKIYSKLNPISKQIPVGQTTILLKGKGLPEQWPSNNWSIQLKRNSKNIDIINKPSTTPTSITLTVPAGEDNQLFQILIINPIGQKLEGSITRKINCTPIAKIQQDQILQIGVHTINISVDSFGYSLDSHIQVYDSLNYSRSQPLQYIKINEILQSTINLTSGRYGIKVNYYQYNDGQFYVVGSVNASGEIRVSIPNNYIVTNKSVSHAGGQLSVLGENINPSAIIKIGGAIGKILRQQPGQTTFKIPPLTTAYNIQYFSSLKVKRQIFASQIISDGGQNPKALNDKSYNTYYQSNNQVCYIGIDVGQKLIANAQRIRYFPDNQWSNVRNYLEGAVFQASYDGITYTQLSSVGPEVHSGWNSLLINSSDSYRFFRMRHTNKSECKLGQFQIIGILLNDINSTNDTNVDVIFDDGFNEIIWEDLITYTNNMTPIINSINPKTGNIYGGYNITITGINLGNMDIYIDGIKCQIQIYNQTEVICLVGERNNIPQENTFIASLDNNVAIIQEQFLYVLKWSDDKTWGTDLKPTTGDLVYVPKGMTLLVDQTTPVLQGLVVEQGSIIFADEGPIQIHTKFITINRGHFQAGTQTEPYQNQLKFILYGSQNDVQQPMFGNKGIGCLQCKFSMYGKQRPITWTMLQNTIYPGDTSFQLIDIVDWNVGQNIVIASTSFDHKQAEQRTISSISGSLITVDKPFRFKHFAGIQNYGSDTLQMRAEVGLLSRNIKMMGDGNSQAQQYGSHLMMAGSSQNGLVAHIGYSQFYDCGQPSIVGRYCIHFHMNGDVVDSSVIGNAVHHSFARVLTLHAVNYLYVKDNVGYLVKGHNFFIEDGIEIHNTLDHNLAISSLQTSKMMQTDTSVASFWITNPLNNLINNHAAGGDFYGFWYEIKQHPDGPSANEDICPIGNPLGASHNNVAHSYDRFGLRIFKLYSRKFPCKQIRNDELEDPWSQNPSIESKFSNYVIYKIGEAGVLAEQVGNMIFQNFTIAESKAAALEFYRTNLTKQYVIAQNVVIIGVSNNNFQTDTSVYDNARGVIGPRTSGWKMSQIRFNNFLNTMTILQTCSKCDNIILYSNRALEYFLQAITYSNISGAYLYHQGMKRVIIYDIDASFSIPFDSTTRQSSTLVFNYPHLAQQEACLESSSPLLWDNSLCCDQSVTIRGISITNLMPHNSFKSIGIKVQLISDNSQVVQQNSTDFTQFYSLFGTMQPMDKKFTYSMAFVTGRIYNIWWLTGIDFSHLAIQLSTLFSESQEAIIFRFNYTESRQVFQIGDLVHKQVIGQYRMASENQLNPRQCKFGNYTHNNLNSESNQNFQRNLTVCLTSRGKYTQYQYLDINAIKWKYYVPQSDEQFIKQDKLRYWSNPNDWPMGRIPIKGQNVTIQGAWTMVMDVQLAQIEFLQINGDLVISGLLPTTHIKAKSIWIKSGSLVAGSSSSPHLGQIIIQIKGNKNDSGYTLTPEIAGNKLFVVHGQLSLYGLSQQTSWTRMTSYAPQGTNQIQVLQSYGWKIGDELAIGPSFSHSQQKQKVEITNIIGNTIFFTPSLNYSHYGASAITIHNQYGQLDTRTAVGVLTKKIKLISGDDSGWGFRLIVNSYMDGMWQRKGKIILQGVQINEGGQYDTQNSALSLKTVFNQETSIITKSVFYNCKSYCINIKGGQNININQNIFYIGRINHVRALQISNFTFQANLMIGAIKRQTVQQQQDLVACYASWEKVDQTVIVRDNLCQGSQLHGFAIGFNDCQDKQQSYINNVASSSPIGFIFDYVQSKNLCLKASGVKAYACEIGQISFPPNTQETIFENFIIADCGRAITLRFGKEGDDRTAHLSNSFITAISRPNCQECYGNDQIDCQDNYAIRMLAVTVNGARLPSKFGLRFDDIWREQTYDSKAFIQNVKFQNYKSQYSTLSQCRNNVVFKSHPGAIDMTGSHNLRNTVCNNCDTETLAYFDPPNPAFLTWLGGCGSILCTGKNNYLIHDHTGGFLPNIGVLIANNSQIGNKTHDCQYIQMMNGHYCQRQDFGVLQYESIAPDYNTRIMWPVYLKYDEGIWNTSTNGWIEWEWQGHEPLNKRLGRFVSIVELYKTYNMTFQSEPPIDLRLQLQKKSLQGNSSEYIIVKLRYLKQNSIRVQNRGKIIKPITQLQEDNGTYLDILECGSNKYFYKNSTIHFVVTGQQSCQVRVSLTNSIQLSARFSINYDDFFDIDGPTKFINRICALLKIHDTSRLKIVSIYSGSTNIIAYLDQQTSSIEQSKNHNNQQQSNKMEELQKQISKLYQQGQIQQAMQQEGFGEVFEFNSVKYVHLSSQVKQPITVDEQEEQQQDVYQQNNRLGIIIGVSCGSVSIIIIVIAIYRYKKRIIIRDLDQKKVEQNKAQTLQNISELQIAQKN